MSTPASDTEMPPRPASPPFTILSDSLSDTDYIWLHRDPNEKSLDGSMDSLCRIVNPGPVPNPPIDPEWVQFPEERRVDTYNLGHTLLAQFRSEAVIGQYVGRITSSTSVELQPAWSYTYEDEVYRIDIDVPAMLTDAAWNDHSAIRVKFGPEWESETAQHPPAEAREARGEALPAADERIKMRNYEENGEGTCLWDSDLFQLEVNYEDEEESDMMSDDQRSVVIDEADGPVMSLHRCDWDRALLPATVPSGFTQRPARFLQRDERDGLLTGASASSWIHSPFLIISPCFDPGAIFSLNLTEESPSEDARRFVDDPPRQWHAKYSWDEDIAWIDFANPPEASAFSDANSASFEILFLGRQPSEPLPPRADALLLGPLPKDQSQSQAVEMTRCVVNGVPNFADNEWSSQWYYTGLWEGKVVDSQGTKHDVTIGTKRRARHSYMQDLVEKVESSE